MYVCIDLQTTRIASNTANSSADRWNSLAEPMCKVYNDLQCAFIQLYVLSFRMAFVYAIMQRLHAKLRAYLCMLWMQDDCSNYHVRLQRES